MRSVWNSQGEAENKVFVFVSDTSLSFTRVRCVYVHIYWRITQMCISFSGTVDTSKPSRTPMKRKCSSSMGEVISQIHTYTPIERLELHWKWLFMIDEHSQPQTVIHVHTQLKLQNVVHLCKSQTLRHSYLKNTRFFFLQSFWLATRGSLCVPVKAMSHFNSIANKVDVFNYVIIPNAIQTERPR